VLVHGAGPAKPARRRARWATSWAKRPAYRGARWGPGS